MQPQVQTQQSIPPQEVQTTKVEPRHKHKNALYQLGSCEIIFGIISVICAIITLIIAANNRGYNKYNSRYPIFSYKVYITYDHAFTWVGQGIWSGLFLIADGILGMKAKNNPAVCMYIANMAMSIITANVMVAFLVLSGNAARVASYDIYEDNLQRLVGLHSFLALVGFIAAILCIVHSAYSCAGVCCRHALYSGPVTYTPQPYGVQQPHQMVMLANGQYMMVPVLPGVPQSYPAVPNPMVTGQVVYQPPQNEVIMPQTTITGEAQFVHPTAVYPPLGSQQPVQDETPAAAAEAPTSYSLHQNEQDKTV